MSGSVNLLRIVRFSLISETEQQVRSSVVFFNSIHQDVRGGRGDGARCSSSVVRAFTHGAMGRRIDPSWGGPIELVVVPASAPQLVRQMSWYVLSCLWDGAYKRTLAVNRKE